MFTLDALLGTCCQVPQVPNGDVFERWQVCVDFGGQEPVDLTLARELGAELGCRDLRWLVEDLRLSTSTRYLIWVALHRLNMGFDVE